MSSYYKQTINPDTGKEEKALWLDDYFGSHKYGVIFGDYPNGSFKAYKPSEVIK